MAEKKAQDFDDLLSGKKQADSEKNLQTLFKEFYSSAKEVDTSKYVNSAKSSLGGLSTKLEERRAKLRKMRQDAMNIDKDKTSDKATDKATETKKDEEKKVDASKDSSKSKTEDIVKEASKDQSNEAEPIEEAKKEVEEPTEPKLSLRDKMTAKFSSINERAAEKYPNAHKKTSHYVGVFADVWQETFPNQEKKVHDKMSKRKERARLAREWEEKQKDMTAEEIAAMEESIPEWKRNAIVIASDDEDEEKHRGVFGRAKDRVSNKINSTEAAQKFYDSEEYKKVEDYRKEYKEFKSELREQVDASHNPIVQASSQLADKIGSDSPCAQAIKAMKKYDPDFDFEELENEAMEIFQEFYCNYLAGNKEYLDLVCGGTAGALCKAQIEQREKGGWRFKYEEPLNASNCMFQGGLIEERVPQFIYHIECQEFDEKVNAKTGEKLEEIEGVSNSSAIMNNSYRIVLSRHEEPDIEVTGHYWAITEFYKIGESRMIA